MGRRPTQARDAVTSITNQQRRALTRQYLPVQRRLTGDFPANDMRRELQNFVQALDRGERVSTALRFMQPRLQLLFEDYAPTIERVTRALERQARALGWQAGISTLQAAGVTFGTPSAQTLASAIAYVESDAFRAIVGAYADYHAQAIVDSIAKGFNPRITALRLATNYNLPLADALRLARTTQLYASRQGSMLLYRQQGVEQWEWSSALDLRTCPSCYMMHGRRFSVDVFGPNDHHNGRCVSIPLVGDWRSQRGTGAEYFGELPPVQQQQILGAVRYAAWRDGILNLDDIPGVYQNDLFGDMIRPKSTKELLPAA